MNTDEPIANAMIDMIKIENQQIDSNLIVLLKYNPQN